MTRVVAAAARLARPGDTVLLAPAAASMDVFRDYAHRGRAFADAVRRAGLTVTTEHAGHRTAGADRRGRAPRRPAHERAPRLRGPAWLDGPMTSCHLVLGAAGLLLAIGLVMVFSASSIEAALADQPAWAPGVQQLDLGGARPGRACSSRCGCPPGFLRRWSPIALLVVVVAAAARAGARASALKLNGARQWFDLGFANFQPSEVGQARLRAVGRARAGAARALPDDDVAAGAGAAGVRRPVAAADRRAGLRRGRQPRAWCSSACCGPAGCRCAGSAGSLAAGAVAGRRHGQAGALPDGPHHRRSSTRSPTPPTAASRPSAACTRWPPAGCGASGSATAR